MKRIKIPLKKEDVRRLKAGDEVLLTGTLYTARDQAHKRLAAAIKSRKRLPLDLKSAVIYYCGPTKTPKAKVIGACGPTTSSRMEEFTPALLKAGLRLMIGKGSRSKEVVSAIKRYRGIYFITYAGCAALLAGRVKKNRLIAYRDLGPEAVHELKVVDFPAIVAVDSRGKDIFKTVVPRRRTP